jgi:hypothetical protein
MSHWNHRVIETQEADGPILAIHEVYYDDAGVPTGHTAPVPVDGETVVELHVMMRSFNRALELPVLKPSDFPQDAPATAPARQSAEMAAAG